MMGMSDIALFSAWYITYIIMFTIGAVLIAIVTSQTMFPNSSGVLLFIYFFLFGISSVAVCFFLSTFFSRSKIATTVGTVIFLAMFFPYYAVNGATKSYGSKLLASLLPGVGFALSLDVLATLEDNGVGATAHTTAQQFNNFTFSGGA
jgi:ATP-binding cassette, subfamily A (ABC1), member 3